MEISDCPGRTLAFFISNTNLSYNGDMWNEVGRFGATLLHFGNRELAIFYESEYILPLFLRNSRVLNPSCVLALQ